jgi:hypothetical protein
MHRNREDAVSDKKVFIATWKQVKVTKSPEGSALLTCTRPEQVGPAIDAYREAASESLAAIGAELRGNNLYGTYWTTPGEIRKALKVLPRPAISGLLLMRWLRIRVVRVVPIESIVWKVRKSAGMSCYEQEMSDGCARARAAVRSRLGIVIVNDTAVVPRGLTRGRTRSLVDECLITLTIHDLV